MAKVTRESLKKNKNKLMTLKSWYQLEIKRLEMNNEIKDLQKYGRVSAFFRTAKVKYGSELALKNRSEWTSLFNRFDY